jgi:hypothetical protein
MSTKEVDKTEPAKVVEKTEPAKVVEKTEPATFKEIMDKAVESAVRGGTAGAVAMGANVACLMWIRTAVRPGDDGLLVALCTATSLLQFFLLVRLIINTALARAFPRHYGLCMPTAAFLASIVESYPQ